MTLSIPVWLIVFFISASPLAAVSFWAIFVRQSGGDWDFGLDTLFYVCLALILGLFIWVVYLAVT